MSDPLFLALLKRAGLPEPETEARFHETRKWRFDYAWRSEKLALEVEGGVWLKGGGRHTRGAGWTKDAEKYNAATVLGWKVLRVTPKQLHDLETIAMLRQVLTNKGAAA